MFTSKMFSHYLVQFTNKNNTSYINIIFSIYN